MRKNALIICSYTCAIGAFGSFFRWLQNQICYDPETNTMAGGVFSILIPLILLAAAIVFYKLIKKLFAEGLVTPESIHEMFHGTTLAYPIAFSLIALITFLGGFLTIRDSRFDLQAGLYLIIGLLAMLSGLGFPLVCTCAKKRYSPGFISVLMTLPIIMFALWLVASYRQNATIPSVSVYAIEILALCACLAAFFFTAGFAYGRVKPVESLFSTMLAAFLCLMTLSDMRYTGLQFMFVGSAGMLLIENWVMISNSQMIKTTDETPEELVEELPAEEPAEEAISPELEAELDKAVAEAESEETTVVDDDDDMKIWKSDK